MPLIRDARFCTAASPLGAFGLGLAKAAAELREPHRPGKMVPGSRRGEERKSGRESPSLRRQTNRPFLVSG
jgi:hypothetical protein